MREGRGWRWMGHVSLGEIGRTVAVVLVFLI